MAEFFISTLVFFFPLYLIAGLLIVRLVIVKIIHPVIMFFVAQISKKLKPFKKQVDPNKNCQTYELSRDVKGLIIFFAGFSTFLLFTDVQSIRGGSEAYMVFVLSWFLFLFQIYKIELIDDKFLIFHRVFKKTKIEIKDITHGVEGFRYYKLYHTDGSIYLDHMIQGIESFKIKIQSLQPEIETVELSVKNFHKDWSGAGVAFNFFIIALIIIIQLYFFASHIVKMFTNL